MASTVLPNGIIIPEKYSRDWYNDLYHNWQELDNLLGGGTPKDGTLTIQKNGTTVGTFSANQATDETINIEVPAVNDATLTIQKNGTTVDTFTANSSTDKTVNITVPTKTSDLTNDSDFVQSSSLSTVATSGNYNDLSNKPTIPTVNNATLTIQKNGTNVQTFTANQSTNATANIIVPTKTSNLTNDSNFVNSLNNSTSFSWGTPVSGKLNIKVDQSWLGGILTTANTTIPTNTSDLTNDSGFITADYAVPRSGGAVMAGGLFFVTDDAGWTMGGGPDATKGGTIWLLGANYAQRGYIILQPAESSSVKQRMNLVPDGTLTWSGQPIQYGSDARLKQQIAEIDDKLLDAWEDVDLVQFKYNDAVKEKSDNARLHTGYVVQQIDKACKDHNVDISAYGLYCHEEYPQETEEVEVEQADGTKTKERKVIREASEHYSLRYTEALIVECKYLRRCIARLTARIEELEKGNNTK